MQVKITKINRKPITTKFGERTSIGIQTDNVKFSGKWLSGFEDDINRDWQEGDTVDISVEKNDKYLNFKAVPMFDDEVSPIEPDEPFPSKPKVSGNFGTISNHKEIEKDKWDKIAIGKVRHGVACEFIRLGEPLTKETVESINKWTSFIMTGEIPLSKEEKEIDDFIGEYNG